MRQSFLRAVVTRVRRLSHGDGSSDQVWHGAGLTDLAAIASLERRSTATAPALLPSDVPSTVDGLAFLDVEIKRARRYLRPLSLILLDVDPVSIPSPDPAPQPVALLAAVGQVIAGAIRNTDAVAVAPGRDRLMLILPETDESDAEALGRRLEAEIARAFGVPLRWGITHFPRFALTPADLIRHAETTLARGELVPVAARAAGPCQ